MLTRTGKTKKIKSTAMLISTPAMAAVRLSPRTHPTMLTISAAGGIKRIASPPRTARGDPHPGRSRNINAISAGATSESPNPMRPAREGGRLSENEPASFVVMCNRLIQYVLRVGSREMLFFPGCCPLKNLSTLRFTGQQAASAGVKPGQAFYRDGAASRRVLP